MKLFIRSVRPATQVAHPRITTEHGEEGPVDYESGPMVRHPVTGKYRRTRLFDLTLGAAASRPGYWHGSRALTVGVNSTSEPSNDLAVRSPDRKGKVESAIGFRRRPCGSIGRTTTLGEPRTASY